MTEEGTGESLALRTRTWGHSEWAARFSVRSGPNLTAAERLKLWEAENMASVGALERLEEDYRLCLNLF